MHRRVEPKDMSLMWTFLRVSFRPSKRALRKLSAAHVHYAQLSLILAAGSILPTLLSVVLLVCAIVFVFDMTLLFRHRRRKGVALERPRGRGTQNAA